MISNQLADSLHMLVARMARESDQILLEQLGVGLSQYKILHTLQSQPYVQQRAIAITLGQTEASISRQIKLLADKGMLTADKNPDNLREHVTVLTARGQRLIAAAERVLTQYHQMYFASLGPRQQERLRELLGELL